MNGPDYRTAAEYFRDKAHAEKRARLDGTETMTPQTPTDRQRAYKARHRAAGRKEVRNLWAHPDDHAAIKAFAYNLNRKRDRVTA